jgi:hemolysin III
MTLFRPKQHTSTALPGAPRGVRWNYDRVELLVDSVIHSFGVTGGIIGAIALIAVAALVTSPTEIVAVAIYVAGLLAML